MSTNNSNNSAEIMVKGSTFQERGWKEEDNYPDPNTLPLPSQEQRITDVTLSELIPGKYVSTSARVVYLRAIEKQMLLDQR
jgi:hypothetical protein